MIYVLFDESGGLGFNLEKARTSKHFLVTFLITENKKTIAAVMKKSFRSVIHSGKKRPSGLLHAYYEDSVTKIKVLKGLAETDMRVATMRLDKRKVYVSQTTYEL